MDAEERTARSNELETAARRAKRWNRVKWTLAVALGAKVLLLAVVLVPPNAGRGSAIAQEGAVSGSPATLPATSPTSATATGGAAAPAPSDPNDVTALLDAVGRRQTELDERERTLAARDETLALYDRDVTEKIARLEELARKLKEETRRVRAESDQAAQSLAKVYGAMKPAAAAPLLDELDEATALRILTQMKEKQVGEVLPLMNRARAVVLTRSLAGRVMPPKPDAPRG